MNTEDLEKQNPFVVFDSKPLNGLRGFVALHLVVYHSLYYCVYNITIYGAVRLFYKYIIINHTLQTRLGHLKFLVNGFKTSVNYLRVLSDAP